MLYVFVFNFNIIVYSQFIQSDIIQVCCSIKNINTEYIIFLPDLIIFASRAVDIPTGDTHIPSDMSMGIHKPQGYPYHCDSGVLKCPRLFFFSVSKVGLPLMGYTAVQNTDCYLSPCQHDFCAEYRLLSEPMSTRLLNSISSRICRQNTQFNMYTTTSKQEEGCTFKDSHPKCFITTNFDKFHREAFARAVNRGDVLTACFRDIQSQRSIRMEFVIIMILFDVKDYRLLHGSISLSPHSEKIYT